MAENMSKGRKRTAMTRIEDERSLTVTFSKRHAGIFNKARELCTLCNVEMAILILSPTNKPYSFGDPSVNEIVNRFLGEDDAEPTDPRVAESMKEQRKARITELNTELATKAELLDSLKKTGKELKRKQQESQENFWWGAPLENLGREQLEQLKVEILQLKEAAQRQAERLKEEAMNPKPVLPISGSG